MVSAISGSSSDEMKILAQDLLNKIKNADKDGIEGLSKSELSSINTGNSTHEADFLSILNDNFDKIDTDADGQLTNEEISAIKPPPPMGPPPGLQIENMTASSDTSSSGKSDEESFWEKFSDFALKELNKAYQSAKDSGALAKLASSLDLAL